MNPFVLDWMSGAGTARKFLPREAWTPARPPALNREALVSALDASNRRWGLFVKDQLRAWAAGQSVAIVAGQQVGFAGGPLYTLAKLATIVRMRRDLEARGIPAIAFFWLATEDHDFNEVAQLAVPVSTIQRDGVNRQLDLLSIRATRASEAKEVVGPLPVPEALVTELLALYDLPRPTWLREGITFGDSFAELIASVFGNEVVLVDSLLPELRSGGEALFNRIASQWPSIQDALRTRSSDLTAAGYKPQVDPREDGDYTLFFEIDARGQRRIITDPRPVEPERTSTSALTRPLLQDEVLRPAVFVGGPAEVAYYAQISPLHAQLGIAMPRVALRAHALVAPKRVVRAINRFELDASEVFGPPEDLLASREV
ncbi:MAG TPA: bacillithiol biosynthesis BshC, partial [Thermoanaerobaculia bacterium]